MTAQPILNTTLLSLLCAASASSVALASTTLYVAHGGGSTSGTTHGGEIGIIDQVTFAYTALGSYGSLTSLATDGTSLYTFQATTNNLLKIDPANGAILASVASAQQLTDMAYNPANGGFYGVATNNNLYSINVATGAATFINSTSFSGGGFRQIAFAPNGTLYMHATNSPGSFFVIDPVTGLSISTIPGGVPGGALGLDFDPGNGNLIASECCGGSDGSVGERLWSVNPVSGAPTLLFDYNDGRRMQDFAFITSAAVPEPTSLWLLGIGLAAAGARRSRKARTNG